jgi:hypothetical protein
MIQMVSSYIFFCFSKLVHVSYTHTHTHIILALRQNPWNINFEQFLKFPELPRQFSPDMSGLFLGHIWLVGHVRLLARTCPSLRVPAYIRGLSAPFRTLTLFSPLHHHLRWPRVL